MARIRDIRAVTPGEPGTILVYADIYRPNTGGNTRVKWYLEIVRGREDVYKIVGGCSVGLDLHSIGDTVAMKPIIGEGPYSHFLASTE